MVQKVRNVRSILALGLLCLANPIPNGNASMVITGKKHHGDAPAVLWREPQGIAATQLCHGHGGKAHEPKGPFTFVSEDMEGYNPKFVVEAADGCRWKVKLGEEARSETAAARLLQAVGYFADEDYFIPELVVRGVKRLVRGREFVAKDDKIRAARLERLTKDVKKVGHWSWFDNPFIGTKEFTGLKVMMALINNWDLKESNNAIYQVGREHHYLVSDLGASFGNAGILDRSKGNLRDYSQSKFLRDISIDEADIRLPTRPPLKYIFVFPSYIQRLQVAELGKDLPRADLKWIGQLLAQLSDRQVADVFRGAGFGPEEADGFAQVVRERIAELNRL
jgi:hypothetical protein